MILLDTSVLVEALAAGGRMRGALRGAIAGGERIAIPTLVLYEWLRGPRFEEELDAQEALFPSDEALAFGSAEARLAACALSWDSVLWTLNPADFAGIPGLDVRGGPSAQRFP